MTFEDYQRNLKGVNAGSDFDLDYLVSSCLDKLSMLRPFL